MSDIVKKAIFDPIHGFIELTQAEDQIVSSLYFQRLRWIKQLGWSHYIFPGATHTRFAHALGAMHIMHRILKNIGKGVDDAELFNPKIKNKETLFHRTMRIAALLHDIGTFPFSHSVEQGYINHSHQKQNFGKNQKNNHEELGRHIVENTDFTGGITRILKESNIDSQELSKIICGKSSNILANQLVHSDIDVDRMDYLLRDSHYTGVNYGVFELDYLISSMRTCQVDGKEILAINESAITAVEYFLVSRYSWYTQIICEGTGYKFDLLAEQITQYFIENGFVHTFDEIKKLASTKPRAFFGFNDSYFTAKLHECLEKKTELGFSPQINEMIEMLMFRIAPQHLRLDPFDQTLIQSPKERATLVEEIRSSVSWLREKLKDVPKAWVIEDIPDKDIIFTKNFQTLKQSKSDLDHYDAVRIVDKDGVCQPLVTLPQSFMKTLADFHNFIPHIYVSRNTLRYLRNQGLLEELEAKYKEVPKKKSA